MHTYDGAEAYAEAKSKSNLEAFRKAARQLEEIAVKEFTGPVAILMPSLSGVFEGTVHSLIGGKAMLERMGLNVSFGITSATYLPDARETLAEMAVSVKAELTVWIDSDMIFPPETLVEFVRRALHRYRGLSPEFSSPEDVSRRIWFMRAAAYPRRGPEPLIAAVPLEGGDERLSFEDLQPGGIEVAGAGFGLAVIPGAALGLMPSPLFNREWDEAKKAYVGEDFSFCRKLRAAGGQVILDSELPGLGHVVENARDLSWFMLSTRHATAEIPVGVRLRRPPATQPHQRGGVVVPWSGSGQPRPDEVALDPPADTNPIDPPADVSQVDKPYEEGER